MLENENFPLKCLKNYYPIIYIYLFEKKAYKMFEKIVINSTKRK